MAIFVVSGLWHGANWTFIVWGFLNALLFLPSILTGRNRKNMDTIGEGLKFPPLKDIMGMLLTFALVNLLWIFFRANTVADAFVYIANIFDKSFFSIPSKLGGIPMIILLVIMEWRAKTKNHALENLKGNTVIRWIGYISLIMLIIVFTGEERIFIYFQF